MKGRGLEPNVITYSAAISACEKGRRPDAALDLLAEMKARGLAPNVITYNAAISACEKGGRTDIALDLLAEMKGRGLELNVITYNAGIKACFDAGMYADALKKTREAISKDLFPVFPVIPSQLTNWDLHLLTDATSCMLLSDALLSIIDSGVHDSPCVKNIIVVTGKGLNTEHPDGPILKEKVPKFLHEVAGLVTSAVEGNEGRFLITGRSLQQWASSAKYGQFKALFGDIKPT